LNESLCLVAAAQANICPNSSGLEKS